MKTEYRVIPVTRYIVTRYDEDGPSASCCPRGEFDNETVAYEVGYALCKAEHDASGEPLDSERFIYPLPIYEGDGRPPLTPRRRAA